jgi:hypothetical protein
MFTAALDAMLILGPLVANADERAGYRVGNAEIRIGNTKPHTGPLANVRDDWKRRSGLFDIINDKRRLSC